MKTNQMMFVKIMDFTLPIEHKTAMGQLNTLWEYGNQLREAKGKPRLRLDNYLNRPETIEFMLEVDQYLKSVEQGNMRDSKYLVTRELEHTDFKGKNTQVQSGSNPDKPKSTKQGSMLDSKCVVTTQLEHTNFKGKSVEQGMTGDSKYVVTTELEHADFKGEKLTIEYHDGRAKIVGGKLSCIKTKRGKYGGTWANLFILLDAAATLDAKFKFAIYETFINNKILLFRDESGDNFKSLNVAIDKYLPTSKGIALNINSYINSAKLIKNLVRPDGGDWNKATAAQLKQRNIIETKVAGVLEMGLIKDENHLLETITKLKV